MLYELRPSMGRALRAEFRSTHNWRRLADPKKVAVSSTLKILENGPAGSSCVLFGAVPYVSHTHMEHAYSDAGGKTGRSTEFTKVSGKRNSASARGPQGRLPPGTNPRALASLTMAAMQGMSTLARDGASRAMLREIAHASMAAWPPEKAR